MYVSHYVERSISYILHYFVNVFIIITDYIDRIRKSVQLCLAIRDSTIVQKALSAYNSVNKSNSRELQRQIKERVLKW